MSKISCVKKCSSLGNSKNISWLKNKYPSIQHTCNLKEIFADKEIDAVIIATPINTHYNLVKKALLAKKHVFVEKPLSSTLSNAEELIQIAKKNNRLLFVGHIFIFNEILKNTKLKTIILGFDMPKDKYTDDFFAKLDKLLKCLQ